MNRALRMRVWKSALCAGLAMLSAAALAPPDAAAFIPDAKRTLREITRVNRSSGRTKALQFDLTMRIGDREPIAAGQLISHPTGLARLELRGFSGRVDRYVLSGSELMGAKDGERLEQPQPLLQPLFLLQPSSETTLRAALATFGVETSLVGLAPCGDHDCFVFGDPRLAAGSSGRSGMRDRDERLAGPFLSGPEFRDSGPELPGIARFWVDTKDLQVRRIDRDDGVFLLLGPMVSFSKIMVPAWLEVHEPGSQPVRFDVERAVQVNAPPTAFSQEWLMGLPADYQPISSPSPFPSSAPSSPSPSPSPSPVPSPAP